MTVSVLFAGVQRAAKALVEHVLPKILQASNQASVDQGSGRDWPNLKGVLEDALRTGIAMAESPKHESAAEDQWHAIACTVQLAVRCLGISHCTEKVRALLEAWLWVLHHGLSTNPPMNIHAKHASSPELQ